MKIDAAKAAFAAKKAGDKGFSSRGDKPSGDKGFGSRGDKPKHGKYKKPSGATPYAYSVCKLAQSVHSPMSDDELVSQTTGCVTTVSDYEFKDAKCIDICLDSCSSDTLLSLNTARQLGIYEPKARKSMVMENWKGATDIVLYFECTVLLRLINEKINVKPLVLNLICKVVDMQSDLILSHTDMKHARVNEYLALQEPVFPHGYDSEMSAEELEEDELFSNPSYNATVDDGYDPETEYTINPTFPLQDELRALLRKHRAVFIPRKESMDVGPNTSFIIDLVDGANIRKQYPRHVSPAVNADIEAEVQRWLSEGIIRVSSAPFAAPVVPVRKPDGSIRLCIDYRELNKWTQRVHSPLPRIDDCLKKMQGKKYYAKMDLRWGFHQLGVREDCKYLTAFVTKSGTYEFNTVPFGLMNASSIYQRRVEAAVSDTATNSVKCDDDREVFIDDIAVGGSDEHAFLRSLDEILSRLELAKIVLKASKCTFGSPEIEFLGHKVNAKGVSLTADRVQAVRDLPEPRNSAAVRRFLGVANGFRDFIPNYATVAAPLSKLTGRHSAWEWTHVQSTAWKTLTTLVAEHSMRYHLTYRHPIILRPDASKEGVGAVLLQVVDGVEQPIIYISQKFSDAATRWSTIEQEAYGIYIAIMKLESYLLGHHFIIETDHRNLVYMAEATAPKVVRWRLRMQEFDYIIHHIPGVRNVIADALSRCFLSKQVLTNKQAFDKVHNAITGHFGVNRTKKDLRSLGLLWSENCDNEIAAYIQQCAVCQKRRTEQGEMNPALASTSTDELFRRVEIDTLGPLPQDIYGNKYIIVVIDCFSRVIELYAVPDVTAISAARVVFQWCCRYSFPEEIQTDNGPQYNATLVDELLNLFNIKHRFTLPYRPQANGIVERSNAEIIRHLKGILFDKRAEGKWSENLPLVQRIMMTSYHSAIGTYPMRILFGDAVSTTKGLLSEWDDLTKEGQSQAYSAYIESLNDNLRTIITVSQEWQAKNIAKRLIKSPDEPTTFKVGDFVLLKHPSGPPSKLKLFWKGPYKVDKVVNQTYHLLDLLSGKETLAFVDRLKLYYEDPNYSSAEVAAMDTDSYIVEAIVGHRGDHRKASTLKFKVKWLGYEYANDDTDWIPWSEARKNILIKDYLKDHPKLRYLINRTRPVKDQF